MFVHLWRILLVMMFLVFLTSPVWAKDASFVSMSLVEKTVTAPNGAITVKDALTKMKQKIRKRKEDVENEHENFFLA